MKIELTLNNKFNEGDEIWIVSKGYVDYEEGYKWRPFGPHKIYDTVIYIDSNCMEIDYVLSNEDEDRYCEYEGDCFATKEEAQKECDKRNGKKTCNNQK